MIKHLKQVGFERFTLVQSVRLVADNTWARCDQGQRPLGSIANGVTIIITQRFHLCCVTSVVDLGWIPSSPVPGYRLGSRESVRLGRFH